VEKIRLRTPLVCKQFSSWARSVQLKLHCNFNFFNYIVIRIYALTFLEYFKTYLQYTSLQSLL